MLSLFVCVCVFMTCKHKKSCKSLVAHLEIFISAETRRKTLFNGKSCKKILLFTLATEQWSKQDRYLLGLNFDKKTKIPPNAQLQSQVKFFFSAQTSSNIIK